jgi:hypothetical protein
MPKQQQTVTATTTMEITLAPQIRRKLLTELRTYAQLHEQHKALELAMDKIKGKVAAIRDETGEQSLKLEGFTTTLVAPVRKKFNPKIYVKLGGDLELYNQAIEETLTKPYEKITCPGSKDEDA